MSNESAIIGSGTGEVVASSQAVITSQAVTLYGIPVVYIDIVALFVLFGLYLYCRMTRKERHCMSKLSYLKLFFALFIPLFIYNLYNSSLFYNVYDKSWCNNTFWFTHTIFIIISASIVTIFEFIFPYLFITLSILVINCYRKPA
uniref:Uncharacterized protein n=1 Tax=Methanosarcina barkeri (strain Fusaro / DSM 804) TaxID=269797 RepID=Q46A71_METBF